MSDAPALQHNFLTVIQQMWDQGTLPREYGYHHVEVRHDDWCDIWTAERCNCQPEVSLQFSLLARADN